MSKIKSSLLIVGIILAAIAINIPAADKVQTPTEKWVYSITNGPAAHKPLVLHSQCPICEKFVTGVPSNIATNGSRVFTNNQIIAECTATMTCPTDGNFTTHFERTFRVMPKATVVATTNQ